MGRSRAGIFSHDFGLEEEGYARQEFLPGEHFTFEISLKEPYILRAEVNVRRSAAFKIDPSFKAGQVGIIVTRGAVELKHLVIVNP